MELQLPLVRRILDEHPNVEYHVWNLARNDEDRAYVDTISGNRITVFSAGENEHNAVYRHYSQPEFKGHLFVKIDDDIVFLETARFGAFVAAIDKHRGKLVLANIINNGACTPVTPEIWEGFRALDIPLLDIHMSIEFADMAHGHLLNNANKVLGKTIKLIPTEDWTSINLVGYDHATLCHILATIGTDHPEYIGGRPILAWGPTFGDEGVCQVLPRIIMKGFTAAHLTFNTQQPGEEMLAKWREGYRELGERYLASKASLRRSSGNLPPLSEVLCAHDGERPDYDWAWSL